MSFEINDFCLMDLIVLFFLYLYIIIITGCIIKEKTGQNRWAHRTTGD